MRGPLIAINHCNEPVQVNFGRRVCAYCRSSLGGGSALLSLSPSLCRQDSVHAWIGRIVQVRPEVCTRAAAFFGPFVLAQSIMPALAQRRRRAPTAANSKVATFTPVRMLATLAIFEKDQ